MIQTRGVYGFDTQERFVPSLVPPISAKHKQAFREFCLRYVNCFALSLR